MNRRRSSGAHKLLLAAFAVLTLMTWSPLGYGTYGDVPRVLGMPQWAVVALGAAVVLFCLEWLFLFRSGLALRDEEMEDILPRLKTPDAESSDPRKVVIR
ncbi:MAG: hypothetical protein Kow0092_16910 [Deferrisomatales bacterium]